MKDFATLMVRGIVGICSIAATAVVSVFVQRYLNSMNGLPPAGFSPVPTNAAPTNTSPADISPIDASSAPNDIATPPISDEPAIQLESTEPDINSDARANGESDRLEGTDRQNQVMKQFWRKLNR
jgi:hypothetical protein